MRETLKSFVHEVYSFGITPAYAGNTCRFARQRFGLGDHPRVCGKHVHRRRHDHNQPGSPPRMRETRNAINAFWSAIGITPAYAGNTKNRIFKSQAAKDHPRVCGKHAQNAAYSVRSEGSPPRMRETLFDRLS